MAVLDLQGMKAKSETSDDAKRPRNSGASKGCGNNSGLSLLLC